MKFKKFGKLPGKPSELIKLALKDLKAVEKLKSYVVDMGFWHGQLNNGKCAVCLAGAVMVRTMKVDKKVDHYPFEFKNELLALDALDYFRTGNCSYGFACLNLDTSIGEKFNREIINYGVSPKAFKKDMKKLANDLEKEGY